MSEELEALAAKLSLGPGVRVLNAHPCGIIALEKPVGILSHPNDHKVTSRSLIRGKYDYEERRYHDLADEGSVEEVYLLNRLDSATSGVLLATTNAEIISSVIRAFEKGRVRKEYQAIVNGYPKRHPNVWVDRVSIASGHGRGVRAHSGGNMPAKTEIQIMRADANMLGLTQMKLWPITGRTHQLRFQCTMRGHPILGDANYGDFNLNRHYSKLEFARRLFLHSHKVEVPVVLEKGQITFKAESPLPEEFEMLMASNKDARKVSRYAVSPRLIAAKQRERFGSYPKF